MKVRVPRGIKFRHVVFSGAGRRTARVVDLALPAETVFALMRAVDLAPAPAASGRQPVRE